MSGHSAEERFVIVAEARRWRSRAEKAAIVAELGAPGATVSAIARKHNLASSLLFRWRKQFGAEKIKPSAPAGSFVPVMLPAPGDCVRAEPATSPSARSGLIEIELVGGRRIRVDHLVDPAALKRVIDVLEGQPVRRSLGEDG